jgi:hypothetical protein
MAPTPADGETLGEVWRLPTSHAAATPADGETLGSHAAAG